MNDQLVFTAGLLEAFALCPMKFALYRLSDAWAGVPRRTGAAWALHAAVKRCLNECYLMGGPRAVSATWLADRFAAVFDARACADSREEEEQIATGRRLVAQYHADHLHDQADEVRVDLTLEGCIASARWRAYADRRESRPDGSVAYVLYSVSRRPPGESALAEDLRTGVLQILAEQSEGRPVEVEVHALRARRVIDATKRPAELAAIEQQVARQVDRAQRLSNPPALRGAHCRWCHVRSLCPKFIDR